MSLTVKGVTVPEKKGLIAKINGSTYNNVRQVIATSNGAAKEIVWMAQRVEVRWWRSGTSKDQHIYFLDESDNRLDESGCLFPFGGEWRLWWTNDSGSVGKDTGWNTINVGDDIIYMTSTGSGIYTYMNYDMRMWLDAGKTRYARLYKTQVSTSNGSASYYGTMTTAGWTQD